MKKNELNQRCHCNTVAMVRQGQQFVNFTRLIHPPTLRKNFSLECLTTSLN